MSKLMTKLSMVFATILVAFIFTQHSFALSRPYPPTVPESNKAIIVKHSQPIVAIKLRSNRTTGYRWYISEYDKSLVKPMGVLYQTPHVHRTGAGGFAIWTFKLSPDAFEVPHVIHLKLLYAQPWNVSAGQTQDVILVTQTH